MCVLHVLAEVVGIIVRDAYREVVNCALGLLKQ